MSGMGPHTDSWMRAGTWTRAESLPPAVLGVAAVIVLLLVFRVAKFALKLLLVVIAVALAVAAWRVHAHYAAAPSRPTYAASAAADGAGTTERSVGCVDSQMRREAGPLRRRGGVWPGAER